MGLQGGVAPLRTTSRRDGLQRRVLLKQHIPHRTPGLLPKRRQSRIVRGQILAGEPRIDGRDTRSMCERGLRTRGADDDGDLARPDNPSR